jgi:ADP-ribose pyrophosphatase
MAASKPELLFQGLIFRVERLMQPGPDGKEHPREIVRHPGGVVILPVLSDGRVCLLENYRTAVQERLIELPAGTREPGEEPEVTARRELAEETGYRAGRIELLATFCMSPGILDEKMFFYLATDLEPGPMALEGGEDIRVRLATWEEALDLCRQNRIRDAKTLAGLLFYEVFHRPGEKGQSHFR